MPQKQQSKYIFNQIYMSTEIISLPVYTHTRKKKRKQSRGTMSVQYLKQWNLIKTKIFT